MTNVIGRGDDDEMMMIHVQFGWPVEISVVKVTSSLDQTQQPSLYYSPPSPKEEEDEEEEEEEIDVNAAPTLATTTTTTNHHHHRPLLVALHTWSADYRQGGGQVVFANWCIEQKWHFLHPNFRGPNTNNEACGSDLALQDVIDAVQHVQRSTGTVDANRIYVVGVSGGGHMALLLAARYPTLWAGVSAWASISDLEAWWKERSATTSECRNHKSFRKYAQQIESVLGGPPDGSQGAAVMEECRKRSPVTYLSSSDKFSSTTTTTTTTSVNLDINHGISDGREGGSVPFWHSLHAFDAILSPQDKRGSEWIGTFYDTRRVPSPSLVDEEGSSCLVTGTPTSTSTASTSRGEESTDTPIILSDPLYQDRAIHYRRIKDSTRLTIFEGSHEILHVAALNWLAQQRRGQPSVWDIIPTDATIHYMDIDKALAESGK